MAAVSQLDLPKGVVKRIIKEKLVGIHTVDGTGKEVQLNKEALLAFAESAKVFISYVTAAANDLCKEKKRQTLTADDVFSALDELEFQEILPQLRNAFEAHKTSMTEKKEKKAEISRKRKSAGEAAEGMETAVAAAADLTADKVDQDADAAGADELQEPQTDEGMQEADGAEGDAEDEDQ